MSDDRNRPEITRLVAEHHQAVYGYAYRLTDSVADAEDLTQHVFLVAYRKLGQLRSGEQARSWLFAILRNAFLKDRQKRRPTPVANLGLNIDAVPENLPDEEPIDQERLQSALNDLPEKFRIVLVMFYFEDCSYRQIAAELDLPLGTVMSRLARAKRHLRARLTEPGPAAARPGGRSATTRQG